MIDLGGWASEEHRIPDVRAGDFEAEHSESENDY